LSDVDFRILALVAEHGPIKTVKLMALTDLSRSHLLRRTEVLNDQGFLQRSQNSPKESYEFWVEDSLKGVIQHEKLMRESGIDDPLPNSLEEQGSSGVKDSFPDTLPLVQALLQANPQSRKAIKQCLKIVAHYLQQLANLV